jgi:2-keto-4-pentenoate hydratase
MSISPEHITQAATELAARRNSGKPGPRLPESCRPQELEDAWQVQQAVTLALGQALGGWKAALPSPGKLVVGPVYRPAISREALCSVPFPTDSSQDSLKVETELAFMLAADLPAREQPYTEGEIDAAVGSVHAALEICASRYSDPAGLPFAEMLADGLVNNGVWLGPELDAPERAAFDVSWQAGGETRQTVQGKHPNGHPRAPLYWLANFLRERGLGLKAGQVVITGSYAGVLTVPAGKTLRFDYAGLARFEVEFRRH